MLALMRQRNVCLLVSAGLISSFGDTVLDIALPFYIYDVTHSAFATGAMFIASTLPVLLIGSVAGVFVDRWDRKRLMVSADLGRVGLMLALLIVHSQETVWIAYVVAFSESAVARFFTPAKSALIPRLVAPEHLTAANALDSMSGNVVNLIAPTVGGAVQVLAGLHGVVLVDSVSFLLSGVLIARLSVPLSARKVSSATDLSLSTWGQVWHEWGEGLRLVRKERLVVTVFVVMGLAMLGQGLLTALNVVFVRTVLHGTAQVFGWMVTAAGVGGLLGGLAVTRIKDRITPTALMVLGFEAAGLIVVVRTNVPNLPLFLVLTALAPLFITGLAVGMQTLLQRVVPDHFRGRVFAAFGTTTSVLVLVGLGMGSVLGEHLGAVPVLDLAGVLFMGAGLVTLLLLPAATGAARDVTEGSFDTKENEVP